VLRVRFVASTIEHHSGVLFDSCLPLGKFERDPDNSAGKSAVSFVSGALLDSGFFRFAKVKGAKNRQ
jgi:hypothetical protein